MGLNLDFGNCLMTDRFDIENWKEYLCNCKSKVLLHNPGEFEESASLPRCEIAHLK